MTRIVVDKNFESNAERLNERGRRYRVAHRWAITLGWDYAGLSQPEIATLFGMPTTNSVAQTIRRNQGQGCSNSGAP
jgi:hypothetical protein